VTADSGTNADVGQNAKVAQHLWRYNLHNDASIVVPCASNKAGRLYAYQPTVEPNTTLLDYYTGSAAAYSLRSLSTSTTNVVKVRRSGDDAELDFTASEVSGGTLAAWVVAGGGTEDGFVTTWYDQSGNANNATQATAANQPKIVSSGTLVTENGKATLDFDGNNDFLQLSSTINNGGTETITLVSNSNSTSVSRGILRFGTNTYYRIADARGNVDYSYGFPASLFSFPSNTSQKLLLAISNNNVKSLYQNGVASADNTITDTQTATSINRISSSSLAYDGNLQEIVLYPSDQSANRTGIEANINAHYNIYP